MAHTDISANHLFEGHQRRLNSDVVNEFYRARARWVEQNPIRKGRRQMSREENGRTRTMPQVTLASALGVVPLTIQNWEQGAVVPSPESFRLLSEFFADSDFEKKWRAWYEQSPPSPFISNPAPAPVSNEASEN